MDNLDNIEVIEEPTKPKRKLTEKQIANLAKGRQRMKEKREKAKKEKEEAMKLKKEEKQIIKEAKIIKKQQKEDKKGKLRYADRQKAHLMNLKKERDMRLRAEAEAREAKIRQDKIDEFEEKKSELLMKTTSYEQYEIAEEELNNIDEDTICDQLKLQTTIEDLMLKYKGSDF